MEVRRTLRRYRRSRLSDLLFCAALALFSLTGDVFGDEAPPHSWAWVFDLLLPAALYWRRRHPFAVFLAIAGVLLGQWLGNIPAGADISLLFALYAVGRYERNRQRIAISAAVSYAIMGLVAMRSAPDGSQIAALVLLVGTTTAAWVLGVYRRTKNDYVESVLARAATAERERDQQAQLAVAAERARISREMHDIVAHSLSVMIALSDGAAVAAERSPDAAREAMEQSSALGRQALAEMRRLLSVLRDPDDAALAPQPGVVEIDELVAQVRAAGLPVEFVVFGDPTGLTPTAQLTAYRLVQEGLTNVLKHAPRATKAVVTLHYVAHGMEISVENDDHPNDARLTEPIDVGHGVAGMRERAAIFGGTVEVGRRPDGGWRVFSALMFDEQDASR